MRRRFAGENTPLRRNAWSVRLGGTKDLWMDKFWIVALRILQSSKMRKVVKWRLAKQRVANTGSGHLKQRITTGTGSDDLKQRNTICFANQNGTTDRRTKGRSPNQLDINRRATGRSKRQGWRGWTNIMMWGPVGEPIASVPKASLTASTVWGKSAQAFKEGIYIKCAWDEYWWLYAKCTRQMLNEVIKYV